MGSIRLDARHRAGIESDDLETLIGHAFRQQGPHRGDLRRGDDGEDKLLFRVGAALKARGGHFETQVKVLPFGNRRQIELDLVEESLLGPEGPT